VSTTQAHRHLDSADIAPPAPGDLRLEPLDDGAVQHRGQRGPTFDLAAFVVALERHDVAYLLARYAPDGDIRVVDPDSPPPTGRTISGSRAIRSWLDGFDAPGIEVSQLVDGGDRIAFTERWSRRDGKAVVATSTAQLRDGRITSQHTVLVWARPTVDPIDGWTRVSEGLFTKTD
jgi:ketosteroid isomerase-like protein